jgi:hypothetical protein
VEDWIEKEKPTMILSHFNSNPIKENWTDDKGKK